MNTPQVAVPPHIRALLVQALARALARAVTEKTKSPDAVGREQGSEQSD